MYIYCYIIYIFYIGWYTEYATQANIKKKHHPIISTSSNILWNGIIFNAGYNEEKQKLFKMLKTTKELWKGMEYSSDNYNTLIFNIYNSKNEDIIKLLSSETIESITDVDIIIKCMQSNTVNLINEFVAIYIRKEMHKLQNIMNIEPSFTSELVICFQIF